MMKILFLMLLIVGSLLGLVANAVAVTREVAAWLLSQPVVGDAAASILGDYPLFKLTAALTVICTVLFLVGIGKLTRLVNRKAR